VPLLEEAFEPEPLAEESLLRAGAALVHRVQDRIDLVDETPPASPCAGRR
jgi:hypothetical protein